MNTTLLIFFELFWDYLHLDTKLYENNLRNAGWLFFGVTFFAPMQAIKDMIINYLCFYLKDPEKIIRTQLDISQ